MVLKVKAVSSKIGSDIPLPYYATPGSAAMDLHAFRFFDKPFDPQRLYAGLDKAMEYIDGAYVDVFVYNQQAQVRLLVDGDVLKGAEFGCHPCVNTSTLKLSTADVFEKFLPAVGHGYTVVTL